MSVVSIRSRSGKVACVAIHASCLLGTDGECNVVGRARIAFFQPTTARFRIRIAVCDIWLDVEDGRAIEQVHVAHMQSQAFDAIQSQYG
ncbi:MAG: hypothetical protein WDO12_03470 [Pseudomonadota bacterium]